jgi:hypothetical protein
VPEQDQAGRERHPLLPVPAWLIVAHMLFMAWTVVNAHDPPIFMGWFLSFSNSPRRLAPIRAGLI